MKGLLAKWIKLVDLLNKLFEMVFSRLFAKITPIITLFFTSKGITRLKDFFKNLFLKLNLNGRKENLKVKSKEFFLNFASSSKEKSKVYIEKAKSIPKRIPYIIHVAQTYSYKESPKKLINKILYYILFPFKYLKSKYDNLSRSSFLTGSLSAVIICSIFLTSYTLFFDVYEKINPHAFTKDEAPSYQVGSRPDYYKRNLKLLNINNVQLPIYVEEVAHIRSLLIDFTIETSNRYIPKYFEMNEYLVRNKLSESLEPMIPSFPLTQEGKQLLRDKIIKEMNDLLKELQIKGRVTNVLFSNITAG